MQITMTPKAMINEEVLKIVLNDKTFGQREAADIVGGRPRLFKLVGSGAIRAEKKPADRQNGRWHCNAYYVIKWATIGGESAHKSNENT